jgi:hypothetical protein
MTNLLRHFVQNARGPQNCGLGMARPGKVPDMRHGPSVTDTKLPHRVELNLREVGQLFNTMDHSPFHERDLDRDAEEFILSWVREFPVNAPVVLVVYLSEFPADQEPQKLVEEAVHNYFAYRARLNRLEFSRLMKEGRQSLAIGLMFLLGCLAVSNALTGKATGTFTSLTRESLTIAGWVAMWRPMQIYLYDWWPLRRRGRVYEKLSRMPVEVLRAQG